MQESSLGLAGPVLHKATAPDFTTSLGMQKQVDELAVLGGQQKPRCRPPLSSM